MLVWTSTENNDEVRRRLFAAGKRCFYSAIGTEGLGFCHSDPKSSENEVFRLRLLYGNALPLSVLKLFSSKNGAIYTVAPSGL